MEIFRWAPRRIDGGLMEIILYSVITILLIVLLIQRNKLEKLEERSLRWFFIYSDHIVEKNEDAQIIER
jgi:hypothetical protein